MTMNNRTYLTPNDSHKSFYCKAFVQHENGVHTLYSYNTPVCRYDEKSGKLTRLWYGYSATTMRHVNAFLAYFRLPGGGKAWWEKLTVRG